MSSVSWHALDESDSDDTSAVLLQPVEHEARERRLSDVDPNIVRRRMREPHNLSVNVMNSRRDETKYKYSLVSILIIGVCLILMLIIGIGMKKCHTQETKSTDTRLHLPPQDFCMDSTLHMRFPWQQYRLPVALSPESYHILLHPNFTTMQFTGQVTINFSVINTTDSVILHSKKHHIKSAYLHALPHGTEIPFKRILYCEKFEMVSFDFGKPLEERMKYQIVIHFDGNLTFSLGGFYLSKYRRDNGEKVVIGTTQFESTDARLAFPCFDEPTFKANFSLSMIRDPSMHTLFNMPLVKTSMYNDNLLQDDFMSTVKMSTYLVAFIVSDFVGINKATKSGIQVSVFSSPDKINETKYALDFAVKILEYYERLFKIPFPLPKMDLVAIPDFAAGAMENWGLVTYRETALLYNVETSSIHDQEWVAKVIAHELSHQWFGNLVTMKWWNDLWLNEGFATYMEYFSVNQIEKDWNVMADLVIDDVLRAMATDSSAFTHPISVSVTNSAEIDEMFDAISYSKGASLIAMLMDFLGEDTFINGVNAYLKKFAYGNAANNDLIHMLSEEDKSRHQNIHGIMNIWTTLPGFPVVKISSSGNQVTMQQSRFFYPVSDTARDLSSMWPIPLTYVTNRMPRTAEREFLSSAANSMNVEDFKWIKFNHNFIGYYKVSYDEPLWERLIDQLVSDHNVFTVNDRVSLISDAFASAKKGKLTYKNLFKLLGYLQNESAYAPVVTAISGLGSITHVLRLSLQDQAENALKSYVVHLLARLYNELAWKKVFQLDRQQAKLQSTVVLMSCRYDHEGCVATALEKFKAWKENGSDISANDMPTVFTTAVLHGDEAEWDYLWSIFVNATDANLRDKILRAISLTTNPKKILFLLSELGKGDRIRSQSLSMVVASMSSNVVGGSLAWRYVKQHWDDIIKVHSVASFATRSIVRSCLSTLLDSSEVTGAEDFFKSKDVIGMKYVKRALESSRIRLYWFKKHLPSVTQWLLKNEALWANVKP